jgi:hypothetical protein
MTYAPPIAKRNYGEERVKRAELEVAVDELVEAEESVLDRIEDTGSSYASVIDAAEELRTAISEVKGIQRSTADPQAPE